MIDLDAFPFRRLLPSRPMAEDDNTRFVQTYGRDFYSYLLGSPHYIDSINGIQNGDNISCCSSSLTTSERNMVVPVLTGITLQRRLSIETVHVAVQLMTRFFAKDDALPKEWARDDYIPLSTM